ncbi:putative F-box protein At1g53550 [Coffea eugenioides]|uniref:putative F-box protein At1g53550 n=1 Tax=Coffea eugenioides TaxID=49369 RepID=UPI000F60BA4A|nr:putative F-box protein At1g53550 [Coffea eugenioides]
MGRFKWNWKNKAMEKGKGNVSKPPQLPEDVIFNVLKRLPAKSLMRFKKPLAVFPTNPDAHYSTQLPTNILDVYFELCTNVVNGLMCLYDGDHKKFNLLNLSTKEIVTLPWHRSMHSYLSPSYFLGFDPVTKQYKVLYFHRHESRILEEDSKKEAYVLTLANKSWRKMTNCPQFLVVDTFIYVDGAIYWKDKLFNPKGERVIQFFNVGEERFSLLSTPREFTEENEFFIAEIKGNFAVGSFGDEIFKLWIMNKDDYVWVEDQIQLPVTLIQERTYQVIGTTNSGEILLTSKFFLDDSWTDLIFYDLNTKRYRLGNLTLPQEQPLAVGTLLSLASKVSVSLHVENVIPLEFASDQQNN